MKQGFDNDDNDNDNDNRKFRTSVIKDCKRAPKIMIVASEASWNQQGLPKRSI